MKTKKIVLSKEQKKVIKKTNSEIHHIQYGKIKQNKSKKYSDLFNSKVPKHLKGVSLF